MYTLFYILFVIFLILALCFVISLCVPRLREIYLYAYLSVAICLLNLVIQVINICMN